MLCGGTREERGPKDWPIQQIEWTVMRSIKRRVKLRVVPSRRINTFETYWLKRGDHLYRVAIDLDEF
jgi:hypothetical protein